MEQLGTVALRRAARPIVSTKCPCSPAHRQDRSRLKSHPVWKRHINGIWAGGAHPALGQSDLAVPTYTPDIKYSTGIPTLALQVGKGGSKDLYLAVRERPQDAGNVSAALHRLRSCPRVSPRPGVRQGQLVQETLSRKGEDHCPVKGAPSAWTQ